MRAKPRAAETLARRASSKAGRAKAQGVAAPRWSGCIAQRRKRAHTRVVAVRFQSSRLCMPKPARAAAAARCLHWLVFVPLRMRVTFRRAAAAAEPAGRWIRAAGTAVPVIGSRLTALRSFAYDQNCAVTPCQHHVVRRQTHMPCACDGLMMLEFVRAAWFARRARSGGFLLVITHAFRLRTTVRRAARGSTGWAAATTARGCLLRRARVLTGTHR